MKKFKLLLFCTAIFFSCSTDNAEEENPNKDQIYFPYGGINLEKQGKLERIVT